MNTSIRIVICLLLLNTWAALAEDIHPGVKAFRDSFDPSQRPSPELLKEVHEQIAALSEKYAKENIRFLFPPLKKVRSTEEVKALQSLLQALMAEDVIRKLNTRAEAVRPKIFRREKTVTLSFTGGSSSGTKSVMDSRHLLGLADDEERGRYDFHPILWQEKGINSVEFLLRWFDFKIEMGKPDSDAEDYYFYTTFFYSKNPPGFFRWFAKLPPKKAKAFILGMEKTRQALGFAGIEQVYFDETTDKVSIDRSVRQGNPKAGKLTFHPKTVIELQEGHERPFGLLDGELQSRIHVRAVLKGVKESLKKEKSSLTINESHATLQRMNELDYERGFIRIAELLEKGTTSLAPLRTTEGKEIPLTLHLDKRNRFYLVKNGANAIIDVRLRFKSTEEIAEHLRRLQVIDALSSLVIFESTGKALHEVSDWPEFLKLARSLAKITEEERIVVKFGDVTRFTPGSETEYPFFEVNIFQKDFKDLKDALKE